MVARKRIVRSTRKKTVKGKDRMEQEKPEVKVEAKPETNSGTKPKEQNKDMFPDRQPIYGKEVYIPEDLTKLTKNGKPWVPEEHGYTSRLMSPEEVKIQGLRGYTLVTPESGIRFENNPLTEQELGTAGEAGSGVYTHLRDNNEVLEEVCGKEMAEHFRQRSKYVKFGSSFLALAPMELPAARRRQATEISNNSLAKNLIQAAEEAQEEMGKNKNRFGKFSLGRNAQRSEVDSVRKTTKKVWSVPTQIK